MAMITAGDFRNGVTFEMEGKVMQVVEFQHVKPGKGAAFVRTKMKNVITGAVTESRALAGLDVLELHDLHYLAFHLEGHAVAEIACCNHCHWYRPPIS